jgi:hypothetical protein
MAWQFSTNNTPATGAAAMYLLLTKLIAAGWVVKSSSDGTTYNSSGNQITGGGSGANGLANNSAWFRVQDPGGLREYVAQRGTTNLVWRWTYSKSAHFVTGSPSATQVPSASDGQILNGGGTDGAPTFATMFGADASYRYSCAAQSAATMVNAVACYPFFALGWAIGGGANSQSHGLISDVADPVTSVVFNSSDTDPVINYFATSSTNVYGGDISSGSGAGHPLAYVAGVWQTVNAATPTGNTTWTTDPGNGKDVYLEWLFVGLTPPIFPKALAQNMLQAPTTGRGTGSAGSLVTVNDHVYVNQCVLPWDGSSPTL